MRKTNVAARGASKHSGSWSSQEPCRRRDGIRKQSSSLLGLKDVGIDCLKWNTTAVVGCLHRKGRINATAIDSREAVNLGSGTRLHKTRARVYFACDSVALGRSRSGLSRGIAYLISPSPSLSLGHLRFMCELRGDISQPSLLRVFTPPQTAGASSCRTTTPPSLCCHDTVAEHLGEAVLAVRPSQLSPRVICSCEAAALHG